MGWPAETGLKPISVAIEEITRGLKEPYRSQAIERQKASGLWDNSQAAVDERVNRLVPREPGESEHDWSMRCRDWVLEKIRSRSVMRQPGED